MVRAEDIVFIRQFIAQNPGASRRRLSAKLCEAWEWKQANGALCDMICRGLLLMLHRAGEIELPPVRQLSRNPFVDRGRPARVLLDTTPILGLLSGLQPIELEPVRRSGDEPLFNSLMEQYHYLGYEQPVGEHLKYLAWAQGRPIACLAWSSAPRHLGSRDRFIGWNAEARRRNIRPKLRLRMGLKQSQIEGLSERQVRRIEKGEETTYEALDRLAPAHRMDLESYLRELAANASDPALERAIV